MNEHIEKLKQQAYVTKGGEFCFNGGEVEIIDVNKFAELIVAECMSMSDELKAQYLSFRKNTMDFDEKHIYAEGEAACDTLKYKMKKRFGVEE